MLIPDLISSKNFKFAQNQIRSLKKEIFQKAWQKEFGSYNSQTYRSKERCSLKIDWWTDKREYLVIEDNQERS